MNSVSYNLDLVPEDIKERVVVALDLVIPKVIDAIAVDDVKIIFNTDKSQTIPETGVGGVTENPHLVTVSLDINNSNVISDLEEEIKGVVAHELHHAMRNRKYPWPGTLLDDIVAEGLADHFDIEINGFRKKPWTNYLTDSELTEYRNKAKPYFFKQNSEEDYFRWILGFGDDSIPDWAGYSLGYKIVGDYLQKTGKKSSELVEVESQEFIR